MLHTQFVVVLIVRHMVDETHNGMDDAENAEPLDWRERRRLRAWELHEQGWSQRRIAAELGVTQGAIYQWLKRVREKGSIEALRHHPAPGRRTALTDSQIKEIPALLARGPQAFGFRSSKWTYAQIATVLKQVFGVSYHSAHICRLLQKYYPDWRGAKKGRAINK